MSRTFSTNNGSEESLKVSTRCGCSPKARQMRCTVEGRVADLLGHAPQAPMRRAFRKRLQRLADRGGDLVVADLPRCARARLVVKTLHPALREAIAPRADGCGTDADF